MVPIGEPPAVLIVAAQERGGVAEAVAAVAPLLGAPWVGTKPVHRALRAVATTHASVVHLHPSLRARAITRDSVLHRVARGRGAATVVQWHGWDRALAHQVGRSGLVGLLVRYELGRADVIAVTTREQRERWIGWGAGEERVHLVANPFDPARIPRERVVGERRVVLFLGRFGPEKRVPTIVEAFARSGVDARLVLAGDGPARADVLAAVRAEAVQAVLPGWVGADGIRYWLARAGALVLASEEESAPLAVIEALAAGVPVVAPRLGAIPALVGEAGVLVEPADVDALAAGIRQVFARPPPLAVERIWGEHHPDVVARAWSALHRRALALRRAR